MLGSLGLGASGSTMTCNTWSTKSKQIHHHLKILELIFMTRQSLMTCIVALGQPHGPG